jgi:hypothetical protein
MFPGIGLLRKTHFEPFPISLYGEVDKKVYLEAIPSVLNLDRKMVHILSYYSCLRSVLYN